MSLWCRYGARMSALWDSCGALTKTRKLHKKPADGKPPAGLCICLYALIYTM